MTLEEFVEFEHKRLEDFKRRWIAGHNAEPEMYPMSFETNNLGIWNEMLTCFDVEDDND